MNYDLLLNSIRDPIFVISHNYLLLFNNKSATEVFGDDNLGKRCHKILFNSDEPCAECPINTYKIKDISQYRFEKQLLNSRTDQLQYYDVNSTLIENFNGQSVIIESLRDITKAKENEIKVREQANTLIELSTPIISIWDKVLAIPLIGTLDSKRTMLIMEKLLNKIVEIQARIAIIDVTGVGIVDTQVANNLIKTVMAVRLMGSEAIITGIRPEIAQVIVNLGIELKDITTMGSLSEGLIYSFNKLDYQITKE